MIKFLNNRVKSLDRHLIGFADVLVVCTMLSPIIFLIIGKYIKLAPFIYDHVRIKNESKRWKEIGVTIVFCILLVLLAEKGNLGTQNFIERGMADRPDIWLITFKRLLQAPILGEGLFTDVSIDIKRPLWTSPHNLLLLVMLKSGAIGGALLLLLIIKALINSFKYFHACGNWIFICFFFYFIVCMTFDSTHLLYKPNLGWLIFWMPIALLIGEEIRLNDRAPEHSKQ
jgi:hypothetical protein